MLRADVHKPFFRKFLWVFLGCVAYSGWCLYDAWVNYPKQWEIAKAYELVTEKGTREDWKRVAAEKGWPDVTPQKTSEEIGHNIGQQYFQIVLCMLFGVPALIKWLSGQGTWVEGDETLIRNSRGKEVPIDSIIEIDKRKWEDKGIAKIRYEVDGKKATFVMDDFQYDRKAMGELMLMAEAGLTAEEIVGDRLERDKIADREAEAEYEDQDEEGEYEYEDGEYEEDHEAEDHDAEDHDEFEERLDGESDEERK